MGQVNTVPRRINNVEGAAGQVMLSGGPGVLETWGAPAPAAHVHAAGDVTSGQFPLARIPRAATGSFLEGNGVGANPIFNALIAGDIPNLAAAKITSGQFPLARMPRGAAGDVITGTGAGTDPVYATPAAAATLTVADAEVFNGAAPIAWTDLDLSGTIGSQATLVLLKIDDTDSSQYVAVRRNGDTDEFYNASTFAGGTQRGHTVAIGVHTVFLVATDTAGKIEWMASANDNMVIDVMAYIK